MRVVGRSCDVWMPVGFDVRSTPWRIAISGGGGSGVLCAPHQGGSHTGQTRVIAG